MKGDENGHDPNTDTTNATDKEIGKKGKKGKNKKGNKHSFVSIDNVNKKIYPKRKKSCKKTAKKSGKDRTLTKYRETASISANRPPTQKITVPDFDVEDVVQTIRQEETSKLASFAHNLRRSYIQSDKLSKKPILNGYFHQQDQKY